MQLRESLINLAITLALVAIVAVLALALKGPRASIPKAIAIPQAQPTQEGISKISHTKQDKFQIFAEAKLIPSPSNEPDSFRFRVGNEELLFTLYFIDALDIPTSPLSRAKEQAKYYSTTQNVIHEVGQEAYLYVTQLLQKHPTRLFTRWERRSNTDRYYSIIMVELEKGRWVYLADLLVRMGYATISGAVTDLPDSDPRSTESYTQELTKNARYAKEKHLGIWAKTKR
jgi:hypothetical protein